jgi:uncharacterized ferritin-like protein (DUF455 family)
MARKTAHEALARMALVPRVLEARGLDVTPGMIARLRQQGDSASVAVLEVILDEEVRHVAIGSRWFAWCCARAAANRRRRSWRWCRNRAAPCAGRSTWRRARAAGFDDEELRALAAHGAREGRE